jgi:hypothetical protein
MLDSPTQLLLEKTEAGIDTTLSDAGFVIKSRTAHRTLEQGKGALNLDVTQACDGEAKIEFNFHRNCAEVTELCEWLELPRESVTGVLTRVLEGVVGVPFQEVLQ